MLTNIRAQVLATDAAIGYLIMDLEEDVSDEVRAAIAAQETSINTRILVLRRRIGGHCSIAASRLRHFVA